MRKRLTAFALAFLMPLLTLLSVLAPMEANAAEGTTFIVHYGGREDNNYSGWNLWVWEEGHDGEMVEFTADDSFGKVAVYQCKYNTSKIGYIVRLNNWEAKDVDADRFVDITGDTVEIWVTSGVKEPQTTPPEGHEAFDPSMAEADRYAAYDTEGALKVNVHYYTYSETYDNVQCNVAIGEKTSATYPIVETDEFGAVYHAGFLNYEKESVIKLSMNVDEKADTKYAREVDISKAKDGVLDVYVVEGNSEVWYSEETADKTPIIVSAVFKDSTDKIRIKTSKALDTSDPEGEAAFFKVTDEDGNSYSVLKVGSASTNATKDTYVYMTAGLDVSKTYYVERGGYKGCKVAISGAFSTEEFAETYTYTGTDLGQTYTAEKTVLRVWAPTATDVKVNLYEAGDGDCLKETVAMTADVKGTWVCELAGNQHGVYYTYLVTVDGVTRETVDPYAKAVGVNGNRGMIVDLNSTNPEGWDKDSHVTLEANTDAVIYEIHVRDTTIDASSGVENKGKYLGLTEKGTTTASGKKTALDYIVDLGVTHVQIMPMYDYATVDETKFDSNEYNWGYDPKNYNVPEGSYSTDPYHGEVRIKETKEMIQAFHEEGIGVIMDVVYNHMYTAKNSCLDNTVPNYYFRMVGDQYTNGSGCGNETASERSMVRKYIVESCVYWVTEYHVDGFRFDLMGCIDQETMRAVREALDAIDPNIIILGEGWTGGTSGLETSKQTNKRVAYKVPGVGVFSDDIRDAIKGGVSDTSKGFIAGRADQEVAIQFGVAAAVNHAGINYSEYKKGPGAWAKDPGQCITYASCHDNWTLWDKIYYASPDATLEQRLAMNKLSAAIIYTSQGVPFMLSGEELLRTKPIEGTDQFSHNSYNINDYTNSMKWDTLDDPVTADMHEYYKGLIAFRAKHPELRMRTVEDINAYLTFLAPEQDNVVAFTAVDGANEDAKTTLVIYNGNGEAIDFTLPEGKWDIYVNGEKAGTKVLDTVEGIVSVAGTSAMVLVEASASSLLYIIGAVVAVVISGSLVAVVLKKRKKA